MKLISKAANLRLTTAEEISLEVDQLRLHSSQLYLSGDGLRYIDADDQESLGEATPIQRAEAQRLPPAGSSAPKPLRGYDLVSINGLLLAAS